MIDSGLMSTSWYSPQWMHLITSSSQFYTWLILCVQVSSFTARGLKAAFVSAEDCDREVTKGIHGGECSNSCWLVQNRLSATCLGERCYEHRCISKILWPLLLMRQAHCVSKWLVGMYLLSILGKCAIQASLKYYCICIYIHALILFCHSSGRNFQD